MRRNSLLLLTLLVGVEGKALNPPQPPDNAANPAAKAPASAPAPAPTPAPAPAPTPAPAAAPEPPPSLPAPVKPVRGKDSGDDEEQPSKNAPRRFVPTEKGKADEDIPYPVDI